jgi:hypothetical protein
MPLQQSRSAIGAVGELLRTQLQTGTSVSTVDIGRPQTAAGTDGPKFNLFLYHIEIDAHLRNQPLDPGQQTPLWLVLHYLVTAFDDGRDSDSAAAHRLIGEGMLALQELNFLQPSVPELVDNPQPLKVSFDVADAELISKVMQGGQEDPYRLSIAFQVRPVLIAPSEPPSYAPLVESVGPPSDEGVAVIPGLAPVAHRLEPQQFEAGDTVTLHGEEVGEAIDICLGETCFGVNAAPAGRVQTLIPADTDLSPGSYAVTAVRLTPFGRRLASNAVLGVLRPRVTGATPSGLVDEGGGQFSGTITVSGDHLGTAEDNVFVAFYRDGVVVLMVEGTGIANQTTVSATVPATQPLPAGLCRVILRSNGAQALHMPEVDWS